MQARRTYRLSMTGTADIQSLLEWVESHDAVRDVWTAKSFTDRLLVVDVDPDADLPPAVAQRLADNGFRGANDVYDVPVAAGSSAGRVPDAHRHQFVDTRTRGDHQSYVVE